MAVLSLREAAQQAGTSKSTILRAIQSGRMSAPRTDDGGYAIDPAELFRVYPPAKPAEDADEAAERSTDHSEGHDAPDHGTPASFAVQLRNARLEAEISALRAILEVEKRRSDEMRDERDRWHAQAERLLLTAPVVPAAPAHAPAAPMPAPDATPPHHRDRGGFFGWLKRA